MVKAMGLSQEGITIALYDWKELGGTLTISRAERRKNSGKHRLINLLQAKTTQLEQSMKDHMTQKLFADITSEPSKDVTGLFLICSSSPSTTTVGNVSGVTYSWWRNYQVDVGAYGANLTDKLRTGFNTVAKGGGVGGFPNGVLCSQTAYEYYESLGETQKRFINEKMSLDLGFNVLTYKGADMFWDPGIASDVPETGETMVLLNSEHIRLVIDKESDFVMGEQQEPDNQFCTVAKEVAMLNLTCNNRSKLGLLHGIDA